MSSDDGLGKTDILVYVIFMVLMNRLRTGIFSNGIILKCSAGAIPINGIIVIMEDYYHNVTFMTRLNGVRYNQMYS